MGSHAPSLKWRVERRAKKEGGVVLPHTQLPRLPLTPVMNRYFYLLPQCLFHHDGGFCAGWFLQLGMPTPRTGTTPPHHLPVLPLMGLPMDRVKTPLAHTLQMDGHCQTCCVEARQANHLTPAVRRRQAAPPAPPAAKLPRGVTSILSTRSILL